MHNMDIRKAFDIIDHPALIRALRSRGLPKAYVALLSMLYANQIASVNGSLKISYLTKSQTRRHHQRNSIQLLLGRRIR